MGRKVLLALMFICGALIACDDDPVQPGEDVTQADLLLYPSAAGQGTTLTVHLESTRSKFVFGETTLDLGEGIHVMSVTVSDGYNAMATVVVDPDAELGARDALISVEESEETLFEAFQVIAESIRIEPANGKMGEIVEVAIVGTATEWEQGYTHLQGNIWRVG